MADTKELMNCSFCKKNMKDVALLIAGPLVFICDECVELCLEIVTDARELKKIKIAAEAKGHAVVSKADAERLAWMRTWAVAGEKDASP